MENLRRRVKIELVAYPIRMRKLVNRPTFKHCTTYNDSLSAVSLHLKEIEFCKPIYIGFAVLEVSKTLMYDYHYNVMKAHYKNAISLMYTDTGKEKNKYICFSPRMYVYLCFRFSKRLDPSV